MLLIQVLSTARAQSFAMPLFALLLWLLARDARQPDRRILLVIPLLALWANLHGSVLLGCALLLLRCVVAIGIALRNRRLTGLRRPLALSCIALVAPFASPYGPALFQYYKGTATNGAFHEYVTEWAGTTLRAWPAFFVFAAVALVAVLRPEIKLRLFDSLCLVALVLAGLDTVRNIVWLPLAVVVLLPSGLAAWSPESTVRSRLRPILTVLTLAGAIGVGVLAAGLSTSKLGASVAHRRGRRDRAEGLGRPVAARPQRSRLRGLARVDATRRSAAASPSTSGSSSSEAAASSRSCTCSRPRVRRGTSRSAAIASRSGASRRTPSS